MPSVPSLSLPSITECLNFNINIPKLPSLPMIKIPELPDLPPIPKLSLPDLPPPPKLPQMTANFDVILDIMKLLTKAMCIIKKLPFFPEVRA
jgi:hypothetical protein